MESPAIIEGTLNQAIPVDVPDRKPPGQSSHTIDSSQVSEWPKDLNRGQAQIMALQETRPSSSSITCSATGANHSHLLAFGIHICPKCHSPIYKEKTYTSNDDSSENHSATQSQLLKHRLNYESNILSEVKQIRKQVQWVSTRLKDTFSESESDSESESEVEEDYPPREDEGDACGFLGETEDRVGAEENGGERLDKSDTVRFVRKVGAIDHEKSISQEMEFLIEFRDAGGNFLHRKHWDGAFDLLEERKRAETLPQKKIAQINTILVTNIPNNMGRSGAEKLRLAKAGFLHNPNVEFKHIKQEIAVSSKQLVEVLRLIVRYYPSVNLRTDVIVLKSPFCLLAHHLGQLEDFKNNLESNNGPAVQNNDAVTPITPQDQVVAAVKGSQITARHIEKLLHFMKTNLSSDQLKAEKARHLQNSPVCTFEMMWLLYKPGTTVYVKDTAGKVSSYVIERFEVNSHTIERIEVDDMEPTEAKPTRPYYSVALWNLNFDGKHVRRSSKEMTVGSFDGERLIVDLKIVPAAIVDASDGGKTRKTLIQRGRKWSKMLTGAQQWHYSGQTSSNRAIDTRVVIDIGSFLKKQKSVPKKLPRPGPGALPYESMPDPGPTWSFGVEDMGKDLANCVCEECLGHRPHPPKGFPWAEYDMIDPEHANLELQDGYQDRDHRYLLCSGLVMGFALKSRTWEVLDVDYCQPAKININAIDTLVMPEERKKMIKAVVQKYTDPMFTPGISSSTWGADFIETKGEGQIFLLHGGPGVGKTYTAECISELIGRPLLSLTCADFGTDEEVMEQRLSSWFKLAESWGAVMLLDEADVWLERRMIADLKRNTLVAVFLRCLEYYRGILFLTSNRVGTFDDAFISRIHLVIYYEDLGEPQRRQIWKQFFDKLERERRDDIIVESRAKHFVLNDSEMRKIRWNGREIRNVFQTAVSLAEYRFHYEGGKTESDKVVLDKVDFEQVCQMSVEFKEYLTKVHNGDDENDRAMRGRARA